MGSSIVQVGNREIQSSLESAEEMVEVLKPKTESKDPVIKQDRGKPVEEAPEKNKAAVELGKKGGEASAKAREERTKEADKAEAKAAPEKAPEGESEAEKPTPKDRERDPQVRIRQLAAEKNALAARLEAREREFAERLERLERGVRPSEPKETPEARPSDGRPTPDNFGTYEEYTEALAEWKVEQKLAEREAKSQAERFQSERQATAQKRREAFIERTAERGEDWQRMDPRLLSMMQDAPPVMEMEPSATPGPANLITEAIVTSDDPTAFALYLSENEQVVSDLIRSDPWSLPMKLGKIEARFAKEAKEEPAREAPRVSKAPPPIRPLATSAQPTEPDLMAPMDYDTYRRLKYKGRP